VSGLDRAHDAIDHIGCGCCGCSRFVLCPVVHARTVLGEVTCEPVRQRARPAPILTVCSGGGTATTPPAVPPPPPRRYRRTEGPSLKALH